MYTVQAPGEVSSIRLRMSAGVRERPSEDGEEDEKRRCRTAMWTAIESVWRMCVVPAYKQDTPGSVADSRDGVERAFHSLRSDSRFREGGATVAFA